MVKRRCMTPAKFEEWWFKGGQDWAEDKFRRITEKEIRRQPSYPNRANAIAEVFWEKAYKIKVCKPRKRRRKKR